MAGVDPTAATQAYLATIPADVRARSDAYTEGGYWLIVWGLLISALVTWIIVRSGLLARVRQWANKTSARPKWASVVVAAAMLLTSWVLGLPWTYYSQYLRQKKYSLTSQPLADWFGQEMIGVALSLVIGSLAVMGLYVLIRKNAQRWWLWGGGASAILVLFFILIAPVFIMPLFNDYKPFPAGPVRDAIVKLAQADGVPTDKIFVFDGSRQRDVVTANVSGILGTARISVSDVALKEANLSEVRAVVGHEIGHYVLGHVYRSSVLIAFLALSGFYLVHRSFPFFRRLFGGEKTIQNVSDPAGLPVLSFIVGLVFTLATPLINTVTRLGENEADNYSLKIARDPDGLSSALIKTVEYRKASPGPVEEFLFHTHPSVENRVRNAMDWKAKNLSGE
jgi:STE24 endopeptidase